MSAKKNALGRGLNALIEDNVTFVPGNTGSTFELAIELIDANPFQPRDTFDSELLEELAESIRQVGIIQPITVKQQDDGRYTLISGERRLRASKLAGLDKVPVFIREANDESMLVMALMENIQRDDLNAIAVAQSYQRLMDEFQFTQENLSQRIGKNRSTIANYLRLLKLPAKIQMGIRDGKISMGHARALINIEDTETQLMIYDQTLEWDFSVRKVEEVVRELKEDEKVVKSEENEPARKPLMAEEYKMLQGHLTQFFGCSVDFKRNTKGKGKIVIPFNSDEELEKIIGIFDRINS